MRRKNGHRIEHVKVLIVEDNQASVWLVEQILNEDHGCEYEVQSASYLDEAIQFCIENKPDVVLLDLGLPGSQGTQTLMQFRKSIKDIPVVVLTGSDDEELGYKCVQLGAEEFLAKGSLRKDILRRSIHYALYRQSSEKAQEKLEGALFHSEELYQLVLENFPQGGTFMINHEGIKLFSKGQVLEVLDQDEEPRLKFSEYFEGPAKERVEIFIDRILSGKKESIEVEANGRSFLCKGIPFSHKLTPDSEARNDISALIIMLDISDLYAEQKAREDLELHVRQIEKMDALGQLAGGVAHDFNNQLTAILGTSELLKEMSSELPNDESTEEFENYLDVIIDSVKKSASLAQELLNFSRKTDAQKEVVHIHNLVKNVVFMLKRSIGKQVQIKVSLKSNRHILEVDTSQVQNALLNLCINAKDAMPKGGVLEIGTREISLKSDSALLKSHQVEVGDYLQVYVKDEGEGVPENIRTRIFEPFFSTKGEEGSGLGLASVFATCKNHDGFVDLESSVGKGTCFSMYYPLGGIENEFKQEEEPVLKGLGRILVVDDESSILQFLKDGLGYLGYSVHTVDSGFGLESGKVNQYELLVLDVEMPKKDGFLVYEDLLKDDCKIPVLFISGMDKREEAYKRFGEANVNYLSKPFRLDQLSHKVAEIINRNVM